MAALREQTFSMTRDKSMRRRRTIDWILGPALIGAGFYLRCFVFLEIGFGAVLVLACWMVGGLLIEDARHLGKQIGQQQNLH
jgi:hypothetical protein